MNDRCRLSSRRCNGWITRTRCFSVIRTCCASTSQASRQSWRFVGFSTGSRRLWVSRLVCRSKGKTDLCLRQSIQTKFLNLSRSKKISYSRCPPKTPKQQRFHRTCQTSSQETTSQFPRQVIRAGSHPGPIEAQVELSQADRKASKQVSPAMKTSSQKSKNSRSSSAEQISSSKSKCRSRRVRLILLTPLSTSCRRLRSGRCFTLSGASIWPNTVSSITTRRCLITRRSSRVNFTFKMWWVRVMQDSSSSCLSSQRRCATTRCSLASNCRRP